MTDPAWPKDAPALEFLRGDEWFRGNGAPLGFTMLDYWRWSGSDPLGNAERGVLAEFLVAKALGVVTKPRREWAAHDVTASLDGKDVAVEVKSAAYRQSWKQDEPSYIEFGIAKSKESWNPETGETSKHDPPVRAAHVYVFCLLGTKDDPDPNPLNTDEWKFYVLDTASIDCKKGDQQRIGLKPLKALVREVTQCGEGREAVRYDQLHQAVMEAAERAMLLNARST